MSRNNELESAFMTDGLIESDLESIIGVILPLKTAKSCLKRSEIVCDSERAGLSV